MLVLFKVNRNVQAKFFELQQLDVIKEVFNLKETRFDNMFYEERRSRYETRNKSFTRSIGATAVLEIAAAVPPVSRSTQNLVTSIFFPSLPPLLKTPPPLGTPCPSLGTLTCALPPLGISDLLMAKPNVQMNCSITRQKVQVAIPYTNPENQLKNFHFQLPLFIICIRKHFFAEAQLMILMKRHSLVGLHSDGFEVISIAVDAFSFSGLKSTLKERGILQNYTFIAYQSALDYSFATEPPVTRVRQHHQRPTSIADFELNIVH
ncbi:hypothetical protein T4A_7083 [Trichinella pseudospiralis]|uniref:Uncharacterized protein n=1 Tax=Trichinella pseudospiralis TaxID=6337 RepID=A0A0V1EAI7_TRIPS|nr:hypothetical protein T4A_7083 [Trichinella pseudospiralis]